MTWSFLPVRGRFLRKRIQVPGYLVLLLAGVLEFRGSQSAGPGLVPVHRAYQGYCEAAPAPFQPTLQQQIGSGHFLGHSVLWQAVRTHHPDTRLGSAGGQLGNAWFGQSVTELGELR